MDIDMFGIFMMCYVVVEYLKKGGKGKDFVEIGGFIISISVFLYYGVNWY